MARPARRGPPGRRSGNTPLDAAVARIEGKPEPKPNGHQRAPRGHNRDAILDYVKKNPGASATAIAEATGITKTTVYATAGKLVQDGVLAKGEKNGRVGYWTA